MRVDGVRDMGGAVEFSLGADNIGDATDHEDLKRATVRYRLVVVGCLLRASITQKELENLSTISLVNSQHQKTYLYCPMSRLIEFRLLGSSCLANLEGQLMGSQKFLVSSSAPSSEQSGVRRAMLLVGGETVAGPGICWTCQSINRMLSK